MTSAKWLGTVIALAVMVFVVTFALNYVGMGGTGTGGDTPAGPDKHLALTFEDVTLPRAPEVGFDTGVAQLDAENHKPGWLDFWFENQNDNPVTVGLFDSCSCLEVQAFLLPLGMTNATRDDAAKQATSAPLDRSSKEGVTVQPRQKGWVRLNWTGQRPQPVMTAQIWQNVKAANSTEKLTANVRFHEPMEADPSFGAPLKFGRVQESNLPDKQYIFCWSRTRDELEIEARVDVRPNIPEPLIIGKPEKMSERELLELVAMVHEGEKKLSQNPNVKKPTVRSAYKVPVTLRSKNEEGKDTDAGPFRRQIDLRVKDYVNSVPVYATGIVEGDIHVALKTLTIDFKSFDRKKGSEFDPVPVQSAKQDLKLEVDRSRTADFLDAELTPESAGNWLLKIRVKPGEANGVFPPDAGVYLRSEGGTKARPTRIAVEGNATER